MSAELRLEGLAELRKTLEQLPTQMRREVLLPTVDAAADGLAADLRAAYPKGTATLADRVVVERGKGERILAKVRSKAPHAHLYEYGTVKRYTRETGANRGTMPASPTFVPLAMRWRARMMQEIAGRLRGLRVRGFDGGVS